MDQVEKEHIEERSNHGALEATVVTVLDDLKMVAPKGMSSLALRAAEIPARVRQQVRGVAQRAFGIGVHQTFIVIHTHYEDLELKLLGKGYTPVESKEALEAIED